MEGSRSSSMWKVFFCREVGVIGLAVSKMKVQGESVLSCDFVSCRIFCGCCSK